MLIKITSGFTILLLFVILTGCMPTASGIIEDINKSDLEEVQKITDTINVSTADISGEIPIIKAVKSENIKLVQELINTGTKCNITDEEGNTLLDIAVTTQNYDIIALILKNINVNIADSTGEIPIIKAVEAKNIEFIQALIDAGAKCDIEDKRNNTLLDIAVTTQNDDIIALVLKNINVNTTGTNGETPIIKATKTDNIRLVQALIATGAKCDVTDKELNTPLHIAFFHQNDDIAALLMENSNLLYVENAQGKTPLDIAEEKGNYALLTKISLDKGEIDDAIYYGVFAVDKNSEDTESCYYLGCAYLERTYNYLRNGDWFDAIYNAEYAINCFSNTLSFKNSQELITEAQERKNDANRVLEEMEKLEWEAAERDRQEAERNAAKDSNGRTIHLSDSVRIYALFQYFEGEVIDINGNKVLVYWTYCSYDKPSDLEFYSTARYESKTWHNASELTVSGSGY